MKLETPRMESIGELQRNNWSINSETGSLHCGIRGTNLPMKLMKQLLVLNGTTGSFETGGYYKAKYPNHE